MGLPEHYPSKPKIYPTLIARYTTPYWERYHHHTVTQLQTTANIEILAFSLGGPVHYNQSVQFKQRVRFPTKHDNAIELTKGVQS